jgi:hypothetical protein
MAKEVDVLLPYIDLRADDHAVFRAATPRFIFELVGVANGAGLSAERS